jgi:uncharacterized RmlC-like cupin family protein
VRGEKKLKMRREPYRIDLPRVMDVRGNLSFIEGGNHIPFKIRRVYWIYDVPGGEIRGGHAFKSQQEFIVALSGSFDVITDTGKRKKRFSLNRSYFGLYVPAGIWRSMENFSTNSLALVLASTNFDESDYIRNYEEFLRHTVSADNFQLPVEEDYKDAVPHASPLTTSSVDDCRLILLDKNHREKGNITVIENDRAFLFNTSRVYYLYDVPGGEERGGHAHRELYQLIIAASGSFDIILDDGSSRRTYSLNRPYQGLYIVPGIWRELVNFSSGSICLVLASRNYESTDYIRDHSEFLTFKTNRR